MPVYFKNISSDIAFGIKPIEKMGGDKITYSMYGDEIPIKDENGKVQGILTLNEEVSIYLRSDGNLYACGYNGYGQLGLPIDDGYVLEFTQIASNVKFARVLDTTSVAIMYIDTKDDLYACGRNTYGCLGLPEGDGYVRTFTKVGRFSNVKNIVRKSNVTYILKEDGDLYAAGDYSALNTYWNVNATEHMPFIKVHSNVKEFYRGGSLIWFKDFNDNLYACGDNYKYGLGNGTDDASYGPVLIMNDVDEVDAHDTANYIITKDKKLYVTGQVTKEHFKKDGKIFLAGSNVKDYIHYQGTSAIWLRDEDNNLWGGGQNGHGSLGTGNETTTTTMGIRATDVAYYSINTWNSWYIDSKGDLYGTGKNWYGNQASGNEKTVTRFTKRASNAKQVLATGDNTAYLSNDGDLYVCGVKKSGILGNAASDDIAVFTKLASNVKCILNMKTTAPTLIWETNDNKLCGTGDNSYGVFGLGGSAYNSAVTNSISEIWPDITKIKEICWQNGTTYSDNYKSAGKSSYIITTDNEIYATGPNRSGGMGTGDKTHPGRFIKMNLPKE